MKQITVGMAQLSVVTLIDVEAAMKANSLSGNIYLIDNNEWNGSSGEGTENLVTAITGTQIINWLVMGVAPYQYMPTLVDIKGEAVEKGIMVPEEFTSPDLNSEGNYWSATVDALDEGKYAYTLVIAMVNMGDLTGGDNRADRGWGSPVDIVKVGDNYRVAPGETTESENLKTFEFTSYVHVEKGFSRAGE
jgi:hypothetical protein